ncbi:MAG: peptidoglycan editing factor PgeF [Actinomycetota bacterium]
MPTQLSETATSGVRLITAAGPGARIAFSDRNGGVSDAPYDSLNLAITVGDDRARVLENRARVAAAAGFDGERLALARQVHGADVIEATATDSGMLGEADVLVTTAPGTTIGIMTADCSPVILVGRRRAAVVHAGWRGVVAGAVERGLEEVPDATHAWIGPSIHACCYEVGPEVVDAFRARGLPVAGPDRVDPSRAATAILHRAGIENVVVSDDCTSCDQRYFSFRRDGVTGRQGGFVTLTT